MRHSLAILVLQLLAIGMIAWGCVVILQVAALAGALLLEGVRNVGNPVPSPIVAAAWIALCAQLYVGLVRQDRS